MLFLSRKECCTLLQNLDAVSNLIGLGTYDPLQVKIRQNWSAGFRP